MKRDNNEENGNNSLEGCINKETTYANKEDEDIDEIDQL